MGITLLELQIAGEAILPEDVEITLPGRKIFRASRPKTVHVIVIHGPGHLKPGFYQVSDTTVFHALAMSNRSPNQVVRFISKLGSGITDPWRRALTQNLGFAAWNLTKDASNSMFMGKDKIKALIPFFYSGIGLLNRLKGGVGMKSIEKEAISQSELLSKSLDQSTTDSRRSIVDSFFSMLAEGGIDRLP